MRHQIYDSGMQLVRKLEDPESRELVLQKLMILFPRNHELLYYMGWIWKDHNFFKAAAWFQQCLNANPGNVENILDYTKMLFDHRYTSFVQHLNNQNQNMLYTSNNPRIMLMAGAILIRERRIAAAEQIFARIFEELRRGDSTNRQFDAAGLCRIYLNMSTLCKYKLLLDKSMQYLHKALALPINDVNQLREVFHSLMLSYDYQYHSSADRMELCRKYADLMQDAAAVFPPRPLAIMPGKRIRVGYVSSGFHRSVIAHFITPILQHHSPADFEIYVFTHTYYSDVAAKYRPWSGHIHVYDIQHLSDADVADFVRQQQVDILVDLQGYTEVSRLGIFGYRAAPVQMTYLGFPNSLGMSTETIQYRITDSVADPVNSTQVYSEQRLYMPRCFLLYSGGIERSQRPVQGGGSIIFGALNKELKNSSACLECWRKILAQVPESKLVLKLCVADMEAEKRHYYMDALHLEDPGRLRLVPYLDSEDAYARLFSNIDILLDTFPYSGTTTTCNAMSASIPVVTLYNPNIHAHNVSASILAHSGFGELIAYTDTEYVKKAVDLARSTAQLQSYRSRIRDGFLKLMNPAEFMTGYEGLLKQTVTVEANRWVSSAAADADD